MNKPLELPAGHDDRISYQKPKPWGMVPDMVVPDDCTDMVTLFTVNGALIYVDPQGNATGYDDVFARIERYRAHFESVGLGADYVKRFMR
jgi:hypothetical protein